MFASAANAPSVHVGLLGFISLLGKTSFVCECVVLDISGPAGVTIAAPATSGVGSDGSWSQVDSEESGSYATPKGRKFVLHQVSPDSVTSTMPTGVDVAGFGLSQSVMVAEIKSMFQVCFAQEITCKSTEPENPNPLALHCIVPVPRPM